VLLSRGTQQSLAEAARFVRLPGIAFLTHSDWASAGQAERCPDSTQMIHSNQPTRGKIVEATVLTFRIRNPHQSRQARLKRSQEIIVEGKIAFSKVEHPDVSAFDHPCTHLRRVQGLLVEVLSAHLSNQNCVTYINKSNFGNNPISK